MDINLYFSHHKSVIFLLFSLFIASNAFAKDVVIGFGKNKAPFVIKETGEGLEIDIFREALAFKGHTLVISNGRCNTLYFFNEE